MVFGVFDGHGGKEVAEYARDHFIRIYGALTVDSNKKVGAYAYKDFFVYPENIENLQIKS